jgi:putative pyrroloquinoline-quinone binding quinoprotein
VNNKRGKGLTRTRWVSWPAIVLVVAMVGCQSQGPSGRDVVQIPNMRCRDLKKSGPGTTVPMSSPWTQYGRTAENADLRVNGPGPPLTLHWTVSEARRYGFSFRPAVIADGRIFVSGLCLFALNSRGEEQWRFQPRGAVTLPASKVRQVRSFGFPARPAIQLSNPVIVGDRVMVAYVSLDDSVIVQALDAATGRRLWTWSSSESRIDDLGLVARGDDLLVIAERRGIKTASVDGTNVWLLSDDGKTRWSTATRSPADITTEEGSGPLAAASRGVAVIPVENGIEAVSMSDGKRLWSAGADKFFPETSEGPLFPPLSYWDLAPVAIVGAKAFAIAGNDSGTNWFRAFSLRSGRVLLERKGFDIGGGVSTFVAAGQRIYLETGFGPRPHHLIALESRGFSVARKVAIDRRAEFLYGGSVLPTKGGFVALAAMSGSVSRDALVHLDRQAHIAWHERIGHRASSRQLTDAPVSTGLTPTGGAYLVSTSDGLLHAFGPAP